MTSNNHLNNLQEALVENWAVSKDTPPATHDLLEALALRVQELFDKDFNKLTTAMYTLDISESKFNTALDLSEPESKYNAVARLILNREMQKVETRMLYEQMKQREKEEQSGDHPKLDDHPIDR